MLNYVGYELSCEMHLVLKKEEVPPVQLGGTSALGWTSWLGRRRSQAPPHRLIKDEPMSYAEHTSKLTQLIKAKNGATLVVLGSAFILSLLLAIPILGERPATIDWVAMLLISGGVYIASGAPLPARRPTMTAARGS